MIITPYPLGIIATRTEVDQMVIDGNAFSTSYYNSSLATSGTIDILIQMSTEMTHVHFDAFSSQDSTIEFYEGTTFSAAGTTLTPVNHNRTSAKTATITISHTPTITGTGTQMNGTQYIPSGAGGGASGGGAGSFSGFLSHFELELSTNYLLRLTNVGSTTAKAELALSLFQENL